MAAVQQDNVMVMYIEKCVPIQKNPKLFSAYSSDQWGSILNASGCDSFDL